MYSVATGASAAAKTASRDNHDVRKRAKARHALRGFARWPTDAASPAAMRVAASVAARAVTVPARLPGAKMSTSAMSTSKPKPAPDMTVNATRLKAGFMDLRSRSDWRQSLCLEWRWKGQDSREDWPSSRL